MLGLRNLASASLHISHSYTKSIKEVCLSENVDETLP